MYIHILIFDKHHFKTIHIILGPIKQKWISKSHTFYENWLFWPHIWLVGTTFFSEISLAVLQVFLKTKFPTNIQPPAKSEKKGATYALDTTKKTTFFQSHGSTLPSAGKFPVDNDSAIEN